MRASDIRIKRLRVGSRVELVSAEVVAWGEGGEGVTRMLRNISQLTSAATSDAYSHSRARGLRSRNISDVTRRAWTVDIRGEEVIKSGVRFASVEVLCSKGKSNN